MASADDDLEELRDRIAWNGDRNFYEGFDVFWAVRRLDSEMPPEVMTLDAWKSHWGPEHENLPKFGKVDWQKSVPADRPVHDHTAADYMLSDLPSNPARGTASDGRDLGGLTDRFPPLPPTASTVPAKTGEGGKEKG